MWVGEGFPWAKFRLDFRSRHLQAPGDPLPQAAASGSGCHSLGSAACGHSRIFCQSRAVALVEVIGQMEGMRPPSTRMMLPVM